LSVRFIARGIFKETFIKLYV